MAPGTMGIMTSVGVFVCLFVGIGASLEDAYYQFSAAFEKLLQIYLEIAKFVLGMAAGGIVVVVSATIFRSTEPAKSLPPRYASPLAVLLLTIFYGVLAMVFLARSWEVWKRDKNSYTRWRYARNQALGFSAIGCFCLGYGWLVMAAVRG